MRVRLGVALAVFGSWALSPAQTAVCVREQARLGGPAFAAFEAELVSLLPQVTVRTGECGSAPEVTIRSEAPDRYRTALGLAHVASGQVTPRLEVYVNPVLRLLDQAKSPAAVGRALARVAAHELVHYLSRRTDHDAAGLFAGRFTPADLKP
jgi:hypothetical protein